jgi:hypothetical protein
MSRKMEGIERREGLVHAAQEAGIKLPPNVYTFSKSEFPHWSLLCDCQLDRPLPDAKAHYRNALVIASISDDTIQGIGYNDIQNKLD